jgi:hypothetical protein
MYQTLEHRYPTQDELFQYMEEHYHPLSSHQQLHEQQLNQMMADDVEHYWNHKHSTNEVLPSRPLTESESLQDISCCICQDEIKKGESVISLPCSHIFHSVNDNCAGIETWIQKTGNCPLCKKPIHEEEEEDEKQDEIYNIINLLANNLNFNDDVPMEDISYLVNERDMANSDEEADSDEADDMDVVNSSEEAADSDEEMPELVSDSEAVESDEDMPELISDNEAVDSDEDMPELIYDEIIIEVSINLSHEQNSDDDN